MSETSKVAPEQFIPGHKAERRDRVEVRGWVGAVIGSVAPPAIFSWILIRAYLHWQGLDPVVPETDILNSEFLIWCLILATASAFALFNPPLIFKLFGISWFELARTAEGGLPASGIRARLFKWPWLFWFYFLAFVFPFISLIAATSWYGQLSKFVGMAIILISALFPVLIFLTRIRELGKRQWASIGAAYISSVVVVAVLLAAFRISTGVLSMARTTESGYLSWVVLFATFALFAFAYQSVLLLSDRLMRGSVKQQVARFVLLGTVGLGLLSLFAYTTGAWQRGLATAAEYASIRRNCEELVVSTQRIPIELFVAKEWQTRTLSGETVLVLVDVVFDYGPILVISRPQQCCTTGDGNANPWIARDWIALQRGDARKLHTRSSTPADQGKACKAG